MKPNEILMEVCNYYDRPVEHLKGPSRLKQIVKPRHLYMYLATRMTECSLSEIGALINRDHSSVSHAIKKFTGCPTLDERIDLEQVKMRLQPSSHSKILMSMNHLGIAYKIM